MKLQATSPGAASPLAIDAALEAITDVTLLPKNSPRVRSLAATIVARQDQPRSVSAKVLDHCALSAMHSANTFDGDARMTAKVEAGLVHSWQQLTGELKGSDELTDSLPWLSVLRKADPTAVAMHSAVHQVTPDGRPIRAGLYEAIRTHNRQDAGEIPTAEKVLLALTALTGTAVLSAEALEGAEAVVLSALAAAATPGLAALGGLAVGYLLATVTESFFHDNIQHASPEARQRWKRLGKVGVWLKNGYLSHAVHHGSTFKKDHVTQFADDAARDRLTTKLEKNGHEKIVDQRFGLTISWAGVARYLSPMVPLYAAAGTAAVLMGASGAAIAGGLAGVLLAPLASKFLHPYLHMTREEAREEAGPVMRQFLDSRVGKYISRHHFVHHARKEGCNYNLLPGGDFLRGKARPPDEGELAEMKKIGMIA